MDVFGHAVFKFTSMISFLFFIESTKLFLIERLDMYLVISVCDFFRLQYLKHVLDHD